MLRTMTRSRWQESAARQSSNSSSHTLRCDIVLPPVTYIRPSHIFTNNFFPLQTMCQNIREQQLLTIENSAPHPPNTVRLAFSLLILQSKVKPSLIRITFRFRVLASLALLPEFRAAFECPYQSPQCKVW